ncbi:hypothetical protein [Coleofasciculus sp. E1-EBD-02]|uniref:hypothetical protein n=1 Tax=Coleofasciculus sp. E1-EBD-02 TaxID=3068481 RepID=UPI0032FE4323
MTGLGLWCDRIPYSGFGSDSRVNVNPTGSTLPIFGSSSQVSWINIPPLIPRHHLGFSH